jgi:23S rRNA (adenine2030-N6)-methyltransferase
VHKHSLLAWTLHYLTQKDKPLSYIETHAGRGLYDLSAEESLKTAEAAGGITLAEQWFPPDHPYRQCLSEVRAMHRPNAYPGSPLIAALSLRDIDTLHLCELHPTEVQHLRHNAQTLDRPKAEFSGFARGDGLVTPPDFVSRIGTLFPIALCGRSSL